MHLELRRDKKKNHSLFCQLAAGTSEVDNFACVHVDLGSLKERHIILPMITEGSIPFLKSFVRSEYGLNLLNGYNEPRYQGGG